MGDWIGLKRGQVRLAPHCPQWAVLAQETIAQIRHVLGDTAVDIQHVGSTAIRGIPAKPIIDIAVAVRRLEEVEAFFGELAQTGIVCRGSDVAEQLLFVKGDFAGDTRSHHIHVVKWNSPAWIDYINFRDFLNAGPDAAREYELLKVKLARRFPESRQEYTAGKHILIAALLRQARQWRRRVEGRMRLISTPLGTVQAVASRQHLLELNLIPAMDLAVPDPENEVLDRTEEWLERYFSGIAAAPDELPLAPDGTDFQRKVWQILRTIPYGRTRTYGGIARAIAPEMSPQAIGRAVGANPIPVIIPCHRVVAANGPGGYSGGLHIKQYLLDRESAADGGE